jgi:hypothetical protein
MMLAGRRNNKRQTKPHRQGATMNNHIIIATSKPVVGQRLTAKSNKLGCLITTSVLQSVMLVDNMPNNYLVYTKSGSVYLVIVQ